MYRSGLVAAGLAFIVGGISGESWIGKENLVNAVVLGASAELGLWANQFLTPTSQLLGDSRICPALYAGIIYTGGVMLAKGAIKPGMGHGKDFAYGAGLAYVAYLISMANSGPGLGFSLRNMAEQASLNQSVQQTDNILPCC